MFFGQSCYYEDEYLGNNIDLYLQFELSFPPPNFPITFPKFLSFLRYTNAYVEIMRENNQKVYCSFQDAPEHRFPGHPESPKRMQALGGWMEKPPYPEIQWLDFSAAEEADITLVHRKGLLAFLNEQSKQGSHEFESSPSYVTEQSYRAALGAVGATLAVSRRILAEGTGRGFAIVRPPGHHAEPDASMGFCLLNNIAIAASDAIASGLCKVAIIDLDAHHGNGTVAAFWDTPEVGYFSTHEGNAYPGTGQIESAAHARGRIINVPLPAFAGNEAYKKIFDQVLKPWLAGFQPEMMFVSAGFDAHFSDPLTTLTLDTTAYYQLARTLVDLADEYCQARVIFVLEGGYDPLALHDNIQACLAALSGHEDYDDNYGKGPNVRPEVGALIEKITDLHHLKEK